MQPTHCPACGAPLPAQAARRACLSCGAPVDEATIPPRARFREVIAIQPQLTSGRSHLKGTRAFPLVIGLVLVLGALLLLSLRAP